MAKKVTAYIKLQVPAGQANPSPPVGPALGQHGVNIMEFCKGLTPRLRVLSPVLRVPVVITVYGDRSFTFDNEDATSVFLVEESSRYQERLWSS